MPERGDALAQRLLARILAIEIAARREKPLDHVGRFDDVATVVVHAEERHRLAGFVVVVVRPGAVIARRALEERHDGLEALEPLIACDELAVDGRYEGADPEPRRAGSDDAVVTGNVLVRHAGTSAGGFPVIAECRFLQHGEQLVVASSRESLP